MHQKSYIPQIDILIYLHKIMLEPIISVYLQTYGKEAYQGLNSFKDKMNLCKTKLKSLKFAEDTSESSKLSSEAKPVSLELFQ